MVGRLSQILGPDFAKNFKPLDNEPYTENSAKAEVMYYDIKAKNKTTTVTNYPLFIKRNHNYMKEGCFCIHKDKVPHVATEKKS